MTMWYSIEGMMKFHKADLERPEVKALLDDEEFCILQHQEPLSGDRLGILIGFNDSVPNVDPELIENLLEAAGKFASEAGVLKVVSDDDRKKIHFGSPDAIEVFKRKSQVKKAKKILKDLSKQELAEVLDSLEKR